VLTGLDHEEPGRDAGVVDERRRVGRSGDPQEGERRLGDPVAAHPCSERSRPAAMGAREGGHRVVRLVPELDEASLLVDGGMLAHAVLRVRTMGIARRGAVRERG
jgi:hypothetical protein